MKKQVLVICLCGFAALSGAQESNPTAQSSQTTAPTHVGTREGVPLYKVQVVGRDIPAVNYFHRSGATKIGFQGTSLLPQAKGSATVESRRGRMVIDAKFEGLRPANSFGQEYLTYVLWAITPEGRPMNLGEILPDGSKSSINVTTDLQSYGLIVTAEPYFSVSMPSDVVVMQNYILDDKTTGIIQPINVHYNLLPRGSYTQTAGQHAVLNPITRNEKSPLELYEAINAVQIAKAAGADTYAGDTMQRADVDLKNAQELDAHDKDKKQIVTLARAVVQTAEDARVITLRKKIAEERAQERQATEQAQQEAKQQTEQRNRAIEEAREAQQKAEAAKAAQQTAEATAQSAKAQAEQTRERLRAQLNQVLATHESARGLIVNMSDVLFDFNKFTLKSEAREKLAKVSGILLSMPGLKLQVEGYTDSVGSEDYNQKLSEERAGSVRDYLVSQGVGMNNISAAGYGKSSPVADNNSAQGRAQNRRVQLVVSGSAIGIDQQSQPGTEGASLENGQQQTSSPR